MVGLGLIYVSKEASGHLTENSNGKVDWTPTVITSVPYQNMQYAFIRSSTFLHKKEHTGFDHSTSRTYSPVQDIM